MNNPFNIDNSKVYSFSRWFWKKQMVSENIYGCNSFAALNIITQCLILIELKLLIMIGGAETALLSLIWWSSLTTVMMTNMIITMTTMALNDDNGHNGNDDNDDDWIITTKNYPKMNFLERQPKRVLMIDINVDLWGGIMMDLHEWGQTLWITTEPRLPSY